LINHEIAYDTVMKSSGVGGGDKHTANSFDLLKIWAKSLKILVKIATNVL